ncbi:MAG TPA: hypothetical protein VNS34_13240 [Rhizobiaceae bacterium]|nr:hypothetical protein [Rhizobiaceae bacterium]
MLAHPNTIVFLAFAAVVGWLSFYIYGAQSDGIAFMLGQAIGVVILYVIVAGINLARRKPVRADIVFGVGAGFLLFINWADIAATYDMKRFQADVRAAGPGNLTKAIQESTTDMASVLRSAMEVANATDAEVQNLFEQLNDPALEGPFAPEKATDRSALVTVNAVANKNLALVSDIMPKVDELLRQEQARLAEFTKRLPQDSRDGLASGLSRKRGAEREYVVKRVEIFSRLMNNVTALSEFLLARLGSFSPNADGMLVFQTQGDVDAYNRMITELQQTVGEQGDLEAEIAAFTERRMAEGWQKMAGPQ